MRRRSDLTGWILMAVLFIGAMALIFYILLMRAQSLSRMEENRTNPDPEPQARIEQILALQAPTIMHAAPGESTTSPHYLVVADHAA